MVNNKSNIRVEVCPSSNHLDAPVTWSVWNGKVFIGRVRKAVDGTVHFEFEPNLVDINDGDLELVNGKFSIADLSRLTNFLKGFPDPVVLPAVEPAE